MELIDNFSEKLWQKADPPPDTGFNPYTVVRNKPLGNGKFQYAVKMVSDDPKLDPHMVFVTIEGAAGKRDPLMSVRNCNFVVDGDVIIGVEIDGDCVMKKL